MTDHELVKDPLSLDPEPDNVWVTLDTLKDAAIDEVNEDSDLVLVVGDVDIKPKYVYKYHKPENILQNDASAKKHTSVNYTTSRYMYCEHCEYKTLNKKNLENHMLRHMVSKILHCHFCSYSTTRILTLKRHIVQQHKIFECKHCPYKTIIKINFSYHIRQHKKDKKQQEIIKESQERTNKSNGPKISKMQIRRERLLRVKNSYKCNKCLYVTLSSKNFQKHILVKHCEKRMREKKTYKCEYCGYVTDRRRNLTNHTRKSVRDNLQKCEECDFESWYMCEYRQHKKSHPRIHQSKKIIRETNDKVTEAIDPITHQHVCEVDGVKYPRMPDSHTLVYNSTKRYIINKELQMNWKQIPVHRILGEKRKDRRFKCTQCVYESRRIDFVRSHVQKQHTDDSVRPYLCLFCNFASKGKGHIRKHNKANMSKELLKCCDCPFTANVKCLLAMHERSHQPYKCPQCPLTFRLSDQWTRHYEVMHVKSKFKCELCDFTTYTINKLNRHQIKHIQVKKLVEI